MGRLFDQIAQALAAFASREVSPALIGGLALAAHDVVRATQDVDFLLDAAESDRVNDILLGLGYRCIHRSEDAANYIRGDEGLDLLYAHRPISRQLLAQARERDTPMGRLRVVSAEGLIAFKLQGFVNDSTRTRDLDDIRSLLQAKGSALDMDEVERYFRLFDRQALFDELVADTARPVR